MNWSDFTDDIRFAGRTMQRSIGFISIAVLIIGLGIGATTTMFSVVNTLLLRPLPFEEPEDLAWVANIGSSGLSGATLRASNLRDWREMNQSFEELTGYFAFFDYINYLLSGDGDPQHLVGLSVARDFLEVLGVQPALGRNFVAEEDGDGGAPAIILTHDFWVRRFGADPGVLGRTLTINGEANPVVGVLPSGFDFSSVFTPGTPIDFLDVFPITDQTDGWGNTLAVIGRLRPGVSIDQAQADLDLINQQLSEADPNRWGLAAHVTELDDQITGRFRSSMLLLVGAVALVLLIACTNLSNMLLARAAARRREIAVRSALGASRSRLIRQMITESLVLSFAGAAAGIGIAFVVTHAVAGTTAVSITLLSAVSVDTTALLFTVAVAFATGMLFGIVPALQVSSTREHGALRDAGRGSSHGKGRVWIRQALVVSEVALAFVLLVGAGLLLRSFTTLLDVDLGFQPEQATAWRVETNRPFVDPAEGIAWTEQLVAAVRSIPGVESVGLSDALPLGRNRSWGVRAQGVTYEDGNPAAFPRIVDSGYLQAMLIPLIAGRYVSPDDRSDPSRRPASGGVVVVNETMATRLWPDQSALGKILLVGSAEVDVVGIVSDVRHSSLEEGAGMEMYLPMAQGWGWPTLDMVVRSSRPVESLAPDVRSTLRTFDASMPTGDFRPLTDLVDRAVSPRRFILLLLGAFAQIALLLAALGVYGVVSYSVSQQYQEIGIRMALGATAGDVRTRIVGRTVGLVSIGLGIGLVGTLAMARLVASMLYGVEPTDPFTIATILVVLTAVSAVAGFIPAHRAARIDPISVINAA